MVSDTSGVHATVTLNGNESKDPENGPLIFSWVEKTNSPDVSINGNTTPNPTVNFKKEGTYTFVLTVTDDADNTDTDEVVIVVNEIKLEPANLEIIGKTGPFCNNKSEQKIGLLATPLGGSFKSEPVGVNVETDASGLFFMPESLNAGTYKLTYFFNDGREDAVTFGISQSFNVDFIGAEAKQGATAGPPIFNLTFKVTQITGAHYQWTFKIDTGSPQTKETDINALTVPVTKEQKLITVNVSVALGGCSAQISKTFEIIKVIRAS
jgi:PKD repeat protein